MREMVKLKLMTVLAKHINQGKMYGTETISTINTDSCDDNKPSNKNCKLFQANDIMFLRFQKANHG